MVRICSQMSTVPNINARCQCEWASVRKDGSASYIAQLETFRRVFSRLLNPATQNLHSKGHGIPSSTVSIGKFTWLLCTREIPNILLTVARRSLEFLHHTHSSKKIRQGRKITKKKQCWQHPDSNGGLPQHPWSGSFSLRGRGAPPGHNDQPRL